MWNTTREAWIFWLCLEYPRLTSEYAANSNHNTCLNYQGNINRRRHYNQSGRYAATYLRATASALYGYGVESGHCAPPPSLSSLQHNFMFILVLLNNM